jgi:DNA-binding response OmpR family regulator
MPGAILLLDHPPGSFDYLAERLQTDNFQVHLCRTPEELLAAIEKNNTELLIAAGDFPEITAPQLAEKVYGKLSIPIILVLSTAGEETQTFLRRHPAIIGVYYRPLNVEKMLDRIRKFFLRQE